MMNGDKLVSLVGINFDFLSKQLSCVNVYVADKYDRKHGLIDLPQIL